MKNKKIAFTLSEVLICMAIIGIIMALSANTIKIVKASYTALSYFAFRNLETAVGVLYSGSAPLDNDLAPATAGSNASIPYPVSKCIDATTGTNMNNGHLIVSVLQNDYEFGENASGLPLCTNRKNSGDKHNSFCNAIAALSNTAGRVNCENLFSTGYNTSTKQPYIVIGSDDLASFNFKTTNGQRFYISEWTRENDISKKYGYRLVAIDLNGERRPNITDSDANFKTQPDIVTFMVLDNGEVFPLGAAADNKLDEASGKRVQYINSNVKGYYFYADETRDRGNVPKECDTFGCNFAVVPLKNTLVAESDNRYGSGLFSYRQAYCTALGSKSSENRTYCNGIAGSSLCPPSNDSKKFDQCRVENIKPMFRYNFR